MLIGVVALAVALVVYRRGTLRSHALAAPLLALTTFWHLGFAASTVRYGVSVTGAWDQSPSRLLTFLTLGFWFSATAAVLAGHWRLVRARARSAA